MKLIQTVGQPYQVKRHMTCHFCQKGMFECVSCEISVEGNAFYTYLCPACNKGFTESESIKDTKIRELRDNCLPNFKLTKEESDDSVKIKDITPDTHYGEVIENMIKIFYA